MSFFLLPYLHNAERSLYPSSRQIPVPNHILKLTVPFKLETRTLLSFTGQSRALMSTFTQSSTGVSQRQTYHHMTRPTTACARRSYLCHRPIVSGISQSVHAHICGALHVVSSCLLSPSYPVISLFRTFAPTPAYLT
jgi:hypothetical protein